MSKYKHRRLIPPDPDRVLINCKFSKKTVDRLLAEATAEERSLSGQIRYVVERYFANHTNKAA